MRDGAVAEGRRFGRILGRHEGGAPGPTILVLGGLHGNEPAGALAAQRVLARLAEEAPAFRGRLVAVAGNLGALAEDRRFLEIDLNRAWEAGRLAALRTRDPGDDRAEEAELRALVGILDELGRSGPLVVLDLHTTSGESAPFTLMSDTLRNRRLAFALPVPVLLGLEESVDGTLLEYLSERGHVAAVVEAGQHRDPRSVDLHESVIWLALVAMGAIDRARVPGYDAHRARLRAAARGLPRVVELRHTYKIDPFDRFTMAPGFRGFQPVRRGDVLGSNGAGPVRTPVRGRLLMPLYQEQGSEGFYIVRRVSRFWLGLSWVLRRLKLAAALPLLPGVRRHPVRPHALLVNPRVARFLRAEVFHLFGFRRRPPEGGYRVFARRRPG